MSKNYQSTELLWFSAFRSENIAASLAQPCQLFRFSEESFYLTSNSSVSLLAFPPKAGTSVCGHQHYNNLLYGTGVRTRISRGQCYSGDATYSVLRRAKVKLARTHIFKHFTDFTVRTTRVRLGVRLSYEGKII